MILAPLLLAFVSAASAAPAQEFKLPDEIGSVMRDIRRVAAGAQTTPRPTASADGDAFGRSLSFGIWGGGKADRLARPEPRFGALSDVRTSATQPAPINRGFQGLGPAGKTGRVKGPGIFGSGDGIYRVIENGPWQIVLQMKTGYIDGRFTLKRDAATGQDSLGFSGRLWDSDNGRMGPPTDSANDGQVSYDAASDSGGIAWRLNGQWRQDSYHGGRAGASGMTITLGGHGHDFTQD